MYSLNDELGFGTHSQDSVREVIEEDPTYIEWALDEVKGFRLDDVAFEKYEEAIDKHYESG